MNSILHVPFFLSPMPERPDCVFTERSTHDGATDDEEVGDSYRTVNAEQEHWGPSVGTETVFEMSERLNSVK